MQRGTASGRRPSSPVTLPAAHGRRLAFWAAILIPTTYLPLLALGLDGQNGAVLAGLVGVNLVCLGLGHEYTP